MNKVYTENININFKNTENVDKLFLIEKKTKKQKNLHWKDIRNKKIIVVDCIKREKKLL